MDLWTSAFWEMKFPLDPQKAIPLDPCFIITVDGERLHHFEAIVSWYLQGVITTSQRAPYGDSDMKPRRWRPGRSDDPSPATEAAYRSAAAAA